MVQEIGETSKAMVEADEIAIQKILDANRDKTELYYIVIFAKPSLNRVKGHEGKPTLVKAIKAYNIRPQSQVGMIIGDVNNKLGTIKWEVNMPDKPFGFHLLGLEEDGKVTYESNIPSAYVYT